MRKMMTFSSILRHKYSLIKNDVMASRWQFIEKKDFERTRTIGDVQVRLSRKHMQR